MTENQVKYQFLDSALYKSNLYDQYYFGNLKGSKETGEYKLIGMILHKGMYYHNKTEEHKEKNHDCLGEFMTIVHKQGRKWLKFHKANVEEIDVDQATSMEYWGGKDKDLNTAWTPALMLYREIKIKNIQLEYEKGK